MKNSTLLVLLPLKINGLSLLEMRQLQCLTNQGAGGLFAQPVRFVCDGCKVDYYFVQSWKLKQNAAIGKKQDSLEQIFFVDICTWP